MSNYLNANHDGRSIGSHTHSPSCDLEGHEVKDKLLWGTIRDPWSWYLSWYSHQKSDLDIHGEGSSEFKDVLMGTLSRDPERCPKNAAIMWCISGESASAYPDDQGGIFTWAFRHTYGDQVKTFVDTKRMHEGVEVLFGGTPSRDSAPPAHTRNLELPKPPEEMYDDEMVEAVYNEDMSLIELLGYEGPFSTLKEPVTEV